MKEIDYDTADNPLNIMYANGYNIVQQFNEVNLITRRDITNSNGVYGASYETFAYDGAYQMTSAANDYSSIATKYNSFGQPIEEQQTMLANSGTLLSQYDIAGNRTGLTYPSGKALTFVPDELNRIQQIKNVTNDVIAQYQYAGPDYRVTERQYPLNGTKLTVGWDDCRRIMSYSHSTTANPPSLIAGFEGDGTLLPTLAKSKKINMLQMNYSLTFHRFLYRIISA